MSKDSLLITTILPSQMEFDSSLGADFVLNQEMFKILDLLPFGITIHNKEYVIEYENKPAVDLLGSALGQQCYIRWQHIDGYGNAICKECPSNFTFKDKKPHSVFRRATTKNGEDLYLEITHIPILDTNDEVRQFIEVSKNVTRVEKVKLLTIENRTKIYSDIYFGLVNFGTSGGDLVATDELPMIDPVEQINDFYTKLAAYWFMAIGQGHQWYEGLYGPLPLMDVYEYNSLSYSFRISSEDADERMQGEDLLMLIIFLRTENTILLDNRQQISDYLKQFFHQYNNITELDQTTIQKLHAEFLPFIDSLASEIA